MASALTALSAALVPILLFLNLEQCWFTSDATRCSRSARPRCKVCTGTPPHEIAHHQQDPLPTITTHLPLSNSNERQTKPLGAPKRAELISIWDGTGYVEACDFEDFPRARTGVLRRAPIVARLLVVS